MLTLRFVFVQTVQQVYRGQLNEGRKNRFQS